MQHTAIPQDLKARFVITSEGYYLEPSQIAETGPHGYVMRNGQAFSK